VGPIDTLLMQVLSGRSDAGVRFDDLCRVMTALGFAQRTKGAHHGFVRPDVVEIVNLQPLQGGKTKPYQVWQVRN